MTYDKRKIECFLLKYNITFEAIPTFRDDFDAYQGVNYYHFSCKFTRWENNKPAYYAVFKWSCGEGIVEHWARKKWPYKEGLNYYGTVARKEALDAAGKQYRPSAMDVLESLVLDAVAEEVSSFEEWCDNFGYGNDSREAERTYNACLDEARKLRELFTNKHFEEAISEIRDICDEY